MPVKNKEGGVSLVKEGVKMIVYIHFKTKGEISNAGI